MAQDMGHANDLLKALEEFAARYLPAGSVGPLIGVGLMLLLLKYFGAGQAIGRGFRWLITRTDRRRAAQRARFADHVESQMRRLSEKEEWRDSRYAELEAELEINGKRRRRFRSNSLTDLRRVRSLSKALEECGDRIVLLEGEPGAGKSVAMRHLTQRMAGKAMRKPSETGVIPIYVNLKTLRCAGKPTAEDVRAFVIASVNAVRDRDVERFLDDEFDVGLREGTWLFLFDSFDEIPDILSATEANEVIVDYADAVHAFLHGMNTCRGIVASREFRGPGRKEWPTFRVMPLSEKRKSLLIKRSELKAEIEVLLEAELPNAEAGVQLMSGNPLFLGLLCEHMREGNDFPTNVHAVLETYIGHRLARDADRLRGHFDVSGEEVRALAEEFAFMIADRQSLGLEVPKAAAQSLLAAATGRPVGEVARVLDALVYTKIARTGDDDSITFSHRRLQEYFATCVVIREPDRVSARTLLTSGRWRETAVTILQTQRTEQSAPLLAEALSLLPKRVPESTEFGFTWPLGLLYLLGILAEGGSPALFATQPEIQRRVGSLLTKAWENGRHFDRKWTLEVCSVADTGTCHKLLESGFTGDSEWLRQESFSQLRKVPQSADRLSYQIRKTLVDLSVGGRLRRERRSVQAQIRRMPNPKSFERALWLLVAGPFLYATIAVPTIVLFAVLTDVGTMATLFYLVNVILFYFVVRFLSSRASTRNARLRAAAPWLEYDETILVITPPLAVVVTFSFGWLSRVWESNQSLFTAGLVVAIALFFLPSGIFALAEGVEESWWSDQLKDLRKFWSEMDKIPLVVMLAITLTGAVGISMDSPELVILGLFGFVCYGLILICLFMIHVVRKVGQRRRLRAFRQLVNEETVSADVLRARLSKLHDVNVACTFFAEMHQKDVTWPDDVISYLHRVARAVEKRDFASEDLPRRAKRKPWVRSSEVLDQLSIFLGAQRKKAEVTPR